MSLSRCNNAKLLQHDQEYSVETNTVTIGYLWAAILGIIQGLAEFLPISSSGHLALIEHLGLDAPAPAALDVLLHLATLGVVIYYFRRTILWYWKNDPLVLIYVVAASIPTGIIGLLFRKNLEAIRYSPALVCLGLIVTAIALAIANERQENAAYQLRDLDWVGVVAVGLCQALALTPGISRSGSTIAGAIFCGVDREEAFSFSFILSIPAVLGATFLHFVDIVRHGMGSLGGISPGPLLLGFILAGATGYLALAILDRLVTKGQFIVFSIYCLTAGVLGLIYFTLLT